MSPTRFVLDGDVDEAVAGILRDAGHEVWRAPDSVVRDDDQLCVYADDQGAVLITHDAELIRRRRRHTFGRHIHLRCQQWRAAEVIHRHLPEVVALLARLDPVVLSVSPSKVEVHPPAWE